MPPKKVQAVNVTGWDFTYFWPEDSKGPDIKAVHAKLVGACSKFVFQVEKAPTTGRLHLQGRIRVRSKCRLNVLRTQFDDILPAARWSPTVTANAASNIFSYCMKEDTRVEGPWDDRNPPSFPQKRVQRLDREGISNSMHHYLGL